MTSHPEYGRQHEQSIRVRERLVFCAGIYIPARKTEPLPFALEEERFPASAAGVSVRHVLALLRTYSYHVTWFLSVVELPFQLA